MKIILFFKNHFLNKQRFFENKHIQKDKILLENYKFDHLSKCKKFYKKIHSRN